jgi:hypothetical protein
MRTLTTRIGDVIDTQRLQERFAQADSGAVSSEQRTKTAFNERGAHEEWKQRIEGDWQSHLEALQQYVSELLRTNQQLRMAPSTAKNRERRYGDAINL